MRISPEPRAHPYAVAGALKDFARPVVATSVFPSCPLGPYVRPCDVRPEKSLKQPQKVSHKMSLCGRSPKNHENTIVDKRDTCMKLHGRNCLEFIVAVCSCISRPPYHVSSACSWKRQMHGILRNWQMSMLHVGYT